MTASALQNVQLVSRPERRNDGRPVLELVRITKSWGPRVILRNVELCLAPGDLVWIGGRNGVGKTTLLRIASGLIRPDGGEVRLLGQEVESRRRNFQRRMGFLSAGDRGLYPRLTPSQHLDLWAALAHIPREQRRAVKDAATEHFELGEFIDRRAQQLSLGQRQRLRLSMAFLHDPVLVLLDEPGNSLDEEGAEVMRAAVRRVLDGGGAAVVCSPIGETDGFDFDRRWLLENGDLVSV